MKKKIKCDIIIPVYKSPEWVKLCVYALFKNTSDELIGKVILINDCDDYLTSNCLENLKRKYSKLEILNNEENLGFIKSTNKGMKYSSADYVLLLNTDCIISNNAIQKLINHHENNKKIGLVCPISSNAANLSLEMYEGFNYNQMNYLLEKKFLGKNFDACTIVGNCLMITRECIDKIGYLDEIYGMGYGEETDYQFKAMKSGFEAKVAIDTYVFHKSEASFGTSKEKQERLNKNREIFFERWGKEYYKLLGEYEKNDPIKYINTNITEHDKKIIENVGIYLIGFSQNAGGVHVAVDMVNYMAINNCSSNIIYKFNNGYDEIMLFNPIKEDNIKKFEFKKIVSTLYYTTFICRKIANDLNIPLIYFAQGYEPYFENGSDYGVAELSYKLADKVLTISDFLKEKYYNTFAVKSNAIYNGINMDLILNNKEKKVISSVTIILRNNYLKGDFILMDIIKKIITKYNKIHLNIIYQNEYTTFPLSLSNKVKLFLGPLKREEIVKILQTSDIFIDASLTEGFGLMALEAMAAGNVCIVSNSGGITQYIKDSENGFIINEVNDPDKYINKLDELLNNFELYKKMHKNVFNCISKYDLDNTIDKYIEFFSKNIEKKTIALKQDEEKLYNEVIEKRFRVSVKSRKKGLLYRICKMVPKKIRIKIKKIVERIYIFTNER